MLYSLDADVELNFIQVTVEQESVMRGQVNNKIGTNPIASVSF